MSNTTYRLILGKTSSAHVARHFALHYQLLHLLNYFFSFSRKLCIFFAAFCHILPRAPQILIDLDSYSARIRMLDWTQF